MLRTKVLVVSGLFLLLSFAGENKASAENAWKKAGLGVASVVGSTLYAPVKVSYAALGAVTGGVTWIVTGGNTELSQKIWRPALGGDYLITPEMLGDSSPSSKP
ncbi:MAG: hypothetical protein ACE5HC_08940 [Candidatus Binatia bacterium]